MQRRKRFTIKVIALGFAVAAIAAPSAQARFDPGPDGTKIVSSRERPRPIQRVLSPQASFDFGAWYQRHWRNIPE